MRNWLVAVLVALAMLVPSVHAAVLPQNGNLPIFYTDIHIGGGLYIEMVLTCNSKLPLNPMF